MTDDQIGRTIIVAVVAAAIGAFRGPIMGWLRRMGYRDWKDR